MMKFVMAMVLANLVVSAQAQDEFSSGEDIRIIVEYVKASGKGCVNFPPLTAERVETMACIAHNILTIETAGTFFQKRFCPIRITVHLERNGGGSVDVGCLGPKGQGVPYDHRIVAMEKIILGLSAWIKRHPVRDAWYGGRRSQPAS